MNSVTDYLIEILVEKFAAPREALTPDAQFENLDFDSLVITELVVILQGRFGVVLEEGEIAAALTIGELAALLSAKGVTV